MNDIGIITLKNGGFTLVDAADMPRVAHLPWRLLNNGYVGFGQRQNGKYATVYLHRLLLGYPQGYIDHKHRNKLDNRRLELRSATMSQNLGNSEWDKTGKSSKYRGVYWRKDTQKWCARVGRGPDRTIIGCFGDETKAAIAYNVAANTHFGKDFARLNAL